MLHAVSLGDKVFKTIGPRSAMMKWWSLSRPECIFRLIITRWIGGNRKL